mmetsp:Transcript_97601/g.187132  ORF Transcript_97601/g.187132 Transcript_97601/m.187132 type:complete len:129 (+) Transcript_97601:72-458(+)
MVRGADSIFCCTDRSDQAVAGDKEAKAKRMEQIRGAQRDKFEVYLRSPLWQEASFQRQRSKDLAQPLGRKRSPLRSRPENKREIVAETTNAEVAKERSMLASPKPAEENETQAQKDVAAEASLFFCSF